MNQTDNKITNAPSRVLIILPRQLGDVVLGLPIIHELRQCIPKATIHWVAHPLASEVLEGHPELDGVFYLPQGKRSYVTRRSGLIGWLERTFGQFFLELAFFRELRNFRADVVIDAMNNPRTSLLAFLSGAPKRISFRTRFQRNIFFTHLIDRSELSDGYLGNSRLNLLRPLLGSISSCGHQPNALQIYRHEQHQEKITKLLASFDLNLNQIPFVVLCPVHRREVRRWPKESFLELARLLVFKHGIPVVWLWGPKEDLYVKPLHDRLEAENRNLQPTEKRQGAMSYFLPLLSIKEAAELCSRAMCWVGNSSGLSHIAVASGCRTVEIHGPTNPIPWTHPDHTKHRSVTRKTGCLACERYFCKLQRRECLEDLAPTAVLREIEDLLNLSQEKGTHA